MKLDTENRRLGSLRAGESGRDEQGQEQSAHNEHLVHGAKPPFLVIPIDVEAIGNRGEKVTQPAASGFVDSDFIIIGVTSLPSIVRKG